MSFTIRQTIWKLGTVLCCCALGLGVCGATPSDMDCWVASLEGAWIGEDNETPMGRMPFAMLFKQDKDGGFRSHSALNRDTWIDMEGLGQQGSTLVPAPGKGAMRRWVDPNDPDFLTIDMAADGESLFMKVMVRGELHVQLDLDRVPDEQLPVIERRFTEGAARAPEEASIHDYANSEEIPPAIREAREATAAGPGALGPGGNTTAERGRIDASFDGRR